MLSYGRFPDVCGSVANVSENFVPSSWASRYEGYSLTKIEQGVPKRRHLKYRHREITQKKAYDTWYSEYQERYI
jgi:hypothetical protein